MKKCWNESARTAEKFTQRHLEWLSQTECLPVPTCLNTPERRGRPSLPFTDKCRRAKQMATQQMRESCSTSELVFSAASAVCSEGRRLASHLVEAAGSPRRGPLLAASVRQPHQHSTASDEEALSMLIYMNFNRAMYTKQRKWPMWHNCRLYPPYHRVSDVKSLCLPPISAI